MNTISVTFKLMFPPCRYVKREIRSLTDDDRERFLLAASTMWQLNSSCGRSRYGSKYSAIADFVSLHSMSSDDIMCDGFHEGERGAVSHSYRVAIEGNANTVEPYQCCTLIVMSYLFLSHRISSNRIASHYPSCDNRTAPIKCIHLYILHPSIFPASFSLAMTPLTSMTRHFNRHRISHSSSRPYECLRIFSARHRPIRDAALLGLLHRRGADQAQRGEAVILAASHTRLLRQVVRICGRGQPHRGFQVGALVDAHAGGQRLCGAQQLRLHPILLEQQSG